MTTDQVWIGNWIYCNYTLVTTNNYGNLTELHTPKITVTTAHIKSSQSSLAVAWYRLPTADVPLTLGSRTRPGLSYQLLMSHYCNSQLTQPKYSYWSLIHSPGKDRTENVSSIIACSLVAGETARSQSCSLVTAVILSPV
jgi:hypothetical protein